MTTGPVVVLGAGGHARVVVESLRAMGYKTGMLLDDDSSKWTAVLSFENGWGRVLGPISDERLKEVASKGITEFVVGIGSVHADGCRLRGHLYLRAMAAHLQPLIVIARNAEIWCDSALGLGVFVGRRAIVMPGAQVGANSIINTGAIVEHDCVVGWDCHVATGAILCGGVLLGHGVHVGAGAMVKQGVKIGDGATVGIGAVVLDDVKSGLTVIGNPARILSFTSL